MTTIGISKRRPSQKNRAVKQSDSLLDFRRHTMYLAGLRLLRDNKMSLKDLADDGLFEALLKEARAPISTKTRRSKFKWSVIHTPSLLKEARNFRKNKYVELSFLMYATYFEHWANDIVLFGLESKNISAEKSKDVLRKPSLEDKLSWVCLLLGLPNIPRQHINTIKQISEVRNAFVHYKWTPQNPDDNGKGVVELLRKTEATIKYLNKYEDNVVYLGEAEHLYRRICNKLI